VDLIAGLSADASAPPDRIFLPFHQHTDDIVGSEFVSILTNIHFTCMAC
jgi:hypothetical protein